MTARRARGVTPQAFRRLFPEFAAKSWAAWACIEDAIFGVRPSDGALMRRVTGRAALPEAPVSEAWILAGRGAGKSRFAARLAAYFATARTYARAPGEQNLRGRVRAGPEAGRRDVALHRGAVAERALAGGAHCGGAEGSDRVIDGRGRGGHHGEYGGAAGPGVCARGNRGGGIPAGGRRGGAGPGAAEGREAGVGARARLAARGGVVAVCAARGVASHVARAVREGRRRARVGGPGGHRHAQPDVLGARDCAGLRGGRGRGAGGVPALSSGAISRATSGPTPSRR